MSGESLALEETVLRLAEPLAASMGLVVVDVRLGRRAGRGVLEVCVDRARADAGFPTPEEALGLSRDTDAGDRSAGVRVDSPEGEAVVSPERGEAVVVPLGRGLPARVGRSGPKRVTARGAGVTLDECEAFSRRLSVLLDTEDPVRGSYVLEVASPGLDRVLRSAREFDHFRGRRVRVRAAAAPEGADVPRRVVVGELLGLERGRVRVRDDDGREWEVPLEQVARAELIPELP